MFNTKNNVLLEGILAELKMINVVVTKLIAHEMIWKTTLVNNNKPVEFVPVKTKQTNYDKVIDEETRKLRRERKLKYMRDYYKRTHPWSISKIDDIQPKKIMWKHIPKEELKTITLNGKKYTYSEFAKKLWVTYDFVYNQIYNGKSVQDMIVSSVTRRLWQKK